MVFCFYKHQTCGRMKILSIDGGGIKGIFAASFLTEIERVCNVKIYEYFDLLAGTSTGGIIAAALAVGLPSEIILNLYMDKAKEIFPKRKNYAKMIFTPKYKKEPLSNALEEVFGDKRIRDCQTRLLIPTYNLENQRTKVFKTPHSQDLYMDKDIKLVDCLLATTAAPTFFVPHRMNGGCYIDGGIGANNPTLMAVIEGITRCNWKKEELSVLSIGGVNEIRNLSIGKENMALWNIPKIIKCYMNAESQYSDNISNLILGKERVLRVNHQDISGKIALDNVNSTCIALLKNWGVDEAQHHVHRIKNEFLDKKKLDVQFFNLNSEQ